MTAHATPDEVQLKYTTVDVLATPEVDGTKIHQLRKGDAVRVTGQVGLFYAVSFADNREGFVFTRNLSGVQLPTDHSTPPAETRGQAGTSPRGRLTGWLQALTGR